MDRKKPQDSSSKAGGGHKKKPHPTADLSGQVQIFFE